MKATAEAIKEVKALRRRGGAMITAHMAARRGWVNDGRAPTAEAPRNRARWNEQEDADLAEAHSISGMPVAELAKQHGRTPLAIETRLSHLGLNDPRG